MVSETIVNRTIQIVRNNPNIDIIEATKQAFIEEQNFLMELWEQKTERSIKAKNQMYKNVYAIIHLQNSLN